MSSADLANSTTDRATQFSFVQILAAPWRYALQPRRAAFAFVHGRALPVASSFSIAMLLFSATACIHYLVNDTIKKQTGVGMFGSVFVAPDQQPVAPNPQHQFGDSLEDAQIKFNTTVLFWVVPVITTGLAVFLTWFLLPTGFVSGSSWDAFLRGMRAVLSGAGFLVLLCNVGAMLQHALQRFLGPEIEFVPVGWLAFWFLGMFSLSALVRWVGVGLRSLHTLNARAPVSVVCEGCGYDLTHQSPTGRCTECGLGIAESLEPGKKRDLDPWSRASGWKSWFAQSLRTLFSPKATYRRLRILGDDGDLPTFVRRHYLCLFAGAWIWATCCVVISEDSFEWNELAMVGTVTGGAAFVAALAGCFIHRFMGASVATWWFARGMFRVPAVAERIICCEAAFLWVFCLFNGTLITSFLFFGDWITRVFGWRFWNVLFGARSEGIVLPLGNAVILVWWLARIHRAFHAVRWANF